MREGNDPRLDAETGDAAMMSSSQPTVGSPARRSSAFTIAATFAALAIALFVFLNSRRDAHGSTPIVVPGATVTAQEPAPPPPLQLGPPPAARTAPAVPAPVIHAAPPPTPPPAVQAKPVVAAPDPLQRRRAPSLVVDLGASGELGKAVFSPGAAAGAAPQPALALAQGQSPVTAIASSGAPSPGAAPVAVDGGGLALAGIAAKTVSISAPGSGAEQFARRVGDEEPGQARATELPNLRSLVAQGTVIPGVLETAIDSDLPGFTRAVVSRDVRNFDGTATLIPRGSRLIGQYKSAVALGQSRAFVIWTRIIRPDGASILIGSPGGDALGRGGLDGKVDRHFFERFGGSILLSVLNAGIAAIGGVPSTQVTIGSPGAAIGAAAAVTTGEAIPPTVKVPQGATIRIFVARDLDFSAVGAAK